MLVDLGNRTIGQGAPCLISFEAGPTHGCLVTPKELVRLAADSGADAVKFQLLDPDRLVSDQARMFSYEVLIDRDSGKTENVAYGPLDVEKTSSQFHRSLYVVQDMTAGDILTHENVRAIRPGRGLPTKYLNEVVGRPVRKDVKRGTALSWCLL